MNKNVHLEKIWKMLTRHEKRLKEMNFNELFSRLFNKKFNILQQMNTYYGVHLALCIDTRDPFKQNRVKYFSPVLHIPLAGSTLAVAGQPTGPSQVTKISELEWAWPISSMGGFDDCGLNWVPPPGSMLAIMFLNGDLNQAFYIGSTWYRNKGPIQHDNWNYQIPEYYKVFEGHRQGYMVGKNDESQVFPPQNTDNYQGFDVEGNIDLEENPDPTTLTTYPHIYSINTPEKHRVIMDDGDPKCNRRWKRLEIISSMGNLFLMKDDPYHHCGEWLNPQCFKPAVDIVPDICQISFTTYVTNISINGTIIPGNEANVITFEPYGTQYPCPQGPDNCPTFTGENPPPPGVRPPDITTDQDYLGDEFLCPRPKLPFPEIVKPNIPADCLNGVINGLTDFCFTFNNIGKNKYQKHRQQCFPYYCQDCGLLQSGIQVRSRSGATLVMDDSVEEPRERTEWERTLKEFDMDGCTGNFKGRTYWKSATGHYIEMADIENQPQLRSERNGINIVTACGNKICLNDETLPGCIAGPLRGIHLESTSKHQIDMCDNTNKQCSDPRRGCEKGGPYAKKAFVRIRSGYGLTMTFADADDQTKTDQQYIQIMSPQKDNLTRGPHVFHMQEKADGPGQVFLRAGGDYIVYSYDQFVEVVGEERDNPADKMEFISRNKLVSVRNTYYNKNQTTVFWADDYIFLLAGRDCDPQSSVGQGQPCIFPVVVAYQQIPEYVSAVTGMKASEHVFASALPEPEGCEGIASDE
jgi:hypothetical protein